MRAALLHAVLPGLLSAVLQQATVAAEPPPPNILLLTVDDMNGDTPGCFGGLEGLTPNIDRLAAEGMRFGRAHVPLAICQPSRQCLMTGRYPHNAGFRWFEPVAGGVPLLTEILRGKGYLNACFGKAEHLQPRERYGWAESMDFTQMKGGRDPARYGELCRAFIGKADAAGKPFFLMANSHDPHRPFHGGTGPFPPSDEATYKPMFEKAGGHWAAPSRVYAPEEAMPLGFLPDITEVRQQTAQYLSSCRRADDTVGEILRALDESGHRDDTLVVFLSDNGMPFQFAKGCVYLNSTRTPLVVRWPGRVAPGSVNRDAFVNGIDFLPTVLEILGVEIPAGTDGRSFLPLLEGKTQEGRDSTVTVFYCAYPVEGGHDPSKTQWFQMRALHRGDMAYIYNAWFGGPDDFGVQEEPDLRQAMAQTGHRDRIRFFRKRAPEELYDYAGDPDALRNLAGDPARAGELRELRGALLDWMRRHHDTDLLEEYEKHCQVPAQD